MQAAHRSRNAGGREPLPAGAPGGAEEQLAKSTQPPPGTAHSSARVHVLHMNGLCMLAPACGEWSATPRCRSQLDAFPIDS